MTQDEKSPEDIANIQSQEIKPETNQIITEEDFFSFDFEGDLPDPTQIDAYQLSSHFYNLARDAEALQQHSKARVYNLLSSLCKIHLRTNDRAQPWGPLYSTQSVRSLIPLDIKGKQNTVILAILPQIKNPGLRARLADIVWSNDRKTSQAATIAINAYQECADGLLEKRFQPAYEDRRSSLSAFKAVQRSFSIMYAIEKKDKNGQVKIPEELKLVALKLYNTAKEDQSYTVFLKTAELASYYGLIEEEQIAKDCENLASNNSEEYVMPIKALWDLAASIHNKLGNKEALKRCKFGSVQQTLAMRKQVHTAGAEAYWVQQALQELRHIEGYDNLEDKLLLELRKLQRASTKEVGTFSYPLNVEALRDEVAEKFNALDLATSLKAFGLILGPPPAIEQLKQAALETLTDSSLLGMISMAHIDDEGKPVAYSPAAESDGNQTEEWYRAHIQRNESFRRQRGVAGILEIARLTIHDRFAIEEDHLEPIVIRSPFIPKSQAALITHGLARYFQGDFMSAAYILIMQLEPCLRHILKLNGYDPIFRRDDGTEEDYDLNAMFKHSRQQLEHIFGKDLIYELDMLFTGRPGPSLRNAIAHGKISSAACFQADVLYGCWLMYRLCMAFLINSWDKIELEINELQ